MFRSRRRLPLLVAALALGLVFLAPSLAWADEEDAPKVMRVRIQKKAPAVQHAAQDVDPMQVVHDWFSGLLQEQAPEGKSLQDGLEAWFAAGKDAPGAGLRDAFKAKGWDAKKLGHWLASQHHGMASGMSPGKGSPHMAPGRQAHPPGPHGMGPNQRGPHARSPRGPGMGGGQGMQHGQGMQRGRGMQHAPWVRGGRGMHHGQGMQHGQGRPHGPWMHGGQGVHGGQGMHRGPQMGRGFMPGGHARQGDSCPQCGHGTQTHSWMGRRALPGWHQPHGPMHGGQHVGPMHVGPMHRGPMHGGPGPWGHVRRGPGQQGPMGGMQHGGHEGARAYILWHDGTGWQRREVPSGAHPQPGMHGKPRMHGQPAPAAGPNHDRPHRQQMPDVATLQKLLEHLKSIRGKADKAGEGVGLDPAQLGQALELLQQLVPQGVHQGDWPQGAKSWLELIRKQQPKAPESQPKRVRIKMSGPKKVEVIEEIEIK